MLREFINRTILLVLVACISLYVIVALFNIKTPLIVYILPIYFGLLNILFIRYLQKSLEQAFSKFTTKYLVGTAIRFMLGLIFVVIFVLWDKQNAIIFVIIFVANYFIFLVHEILELLRFLNSNKPKPKVSQ